MNDLNPFQHAYDDQTTLHPVGLAALVILGLMMLTVRRQSAVLPMLLMASLIAPAQRVAVFGLNFTLLRLMVIFGWVRVWSRKEATHFRWRPADTLIVLWAACGAIIYSARSATLAAAINQLGESYDVLGLYFLFRWLVQGWEDVEEAVRGIILVSVPVAIAFTVEHFTGRNLFAFLGGVSEVTEVRDGRLRCQGAFAHPILAGTFWASLLPLVAARWWKSGGVRPGVVLGVIASLTVVGFCSSSGPIAAVIFAIAGAALFRIRNRMRLVRWTLVATLVVLHCVMKGPVWSLVARADLGIGGTGWHRYILVDGAIRHFSEWWLLGTPSVTHWGDRYCYPLFDVTNQYVVEGIRGGALTMGLFVAVIAMAFGNVGRLWRAMGRETDRVVLAWSLGVSLLVHVVSFMSVSYFGQIIVAWYLLLATITSLESRYGTSQSPKDLARLRLRSGTNSLAAARLCRRTGTTQTIESADPDGMREETGCSSELSTASQAASARPE